MPAWSHLLSSSPIDKFPGLIAGNTNRNRREEAPVLRIKIEFTGAENANTLTVRQFGPRQSRNNASEKRPPVLPPPVNRERPHRLS